MAEINRTELIALKSRPQNADPLGLSDGNFGPPMAQLQSKARSLGAYNIEGLIGKFDPENITMRQRKQMRRDPMIAMGLHYRKSMLINAPWRVDCDDPQVAAFVDGNFRRIWVTLMGQMLECLEWGYKPIVKRFTHEVPTWTYEDPVSRSKKPVWPTADIPAVCLNTFQALPSQGAEVLFTTDGQKFAGFKHQGLTTQITGGDPLIVPPKYALWVANERDTSDGDWYGYPLTGYVYRYWWSYWYRWLLGDRHFEQDADPPLKVEYPPGNGPDPDDPTQTVDNYVIALKAGVNLRDGATVAIPSDYYESIADGRLARGAKKWDAEFMRGGENMKAFQESFNYLDILKLRGLMIPESALIQSGGARGNSEGSFADLLGESQVILMGQILAHINEFIIPDLVAQNFVGAPACKIVTEGFREQDVARALDLINIIASQDPGALQIDWRGLVQIAGFPTLTEEQLNDPKTIIPQSARQKMADAADQADTAADPARLKKSIRQKPGGGVGAD